MKLFTIKNRFSLVYFLLFGLSFFAMTNSVLAAPFTCNGTKYVTTSPSTFSIANTLYSINTTTNPFTLNAIGNNSHGFKYNALAYNPVDNYIYAIQTGGNHIYRIDNAGTTTDLGVVVGLPIGTYSGTFTDTGKFLIVQVLSGTGATFYNSDVLYVIDTVTNPLILESTIPLSNTSYRPGDIIYHPIDGLVYAQNGSDFISINATSGLVTLIGSNTLIEIGTMFADSTGNIYGMQNIGGFYQINTTTGAATLLSSSPIVAGSDGASCIAANTVFESDISLTKTTTATDFASGDTIPYTITITNNGPFGATGISLNDTLPAGTTGSWTCVASAGSACTASGIGNITDTVSLVSGGTATYTLLVTTPPTYTDLSISNTATMVLPVSVTDSVVGNNTAPAVVLNNTAPYVVYPNPTVNPLSTTDTTPVITGTWDEANGNPTSLEVTVNGVTYTLGINPELTTNGTGNWSLSIPTYLVLGTYDIKVSASNLTNTQTTNDQTFDELNIYTPPSSGGSEGSVKYVCKDKNAINFSSFGQHLQSKCKYDTNVPLQDIENQVSEILDTDAICPIFTQRMKKGDRDGQKGLSSQESGVSPKINEIKKLQTALTHLGYTPGFIDGVYGLKTMRAVSAWQIEHRAQVLDPWNLSGPTGWFYQSSERWMNTILGCPESVTLDIGKKLDIYTEEYKYDLEKAPALWRSTLSDWKLFLHL
jgi:uncharacterized repeat protein (TIGR01451 family)